jgi:hypothetical protein
VKKKERLTLIEIGNESESEVLTASNITRNVGDVEVNRRTRSSVRTNNGVEQLLLLEILDSGSLSSDITGDNEGLVSCRVIGHNTRIQLVDGTIEGLCLVKNAGGAGLGEGKILGLGGNLSALNKPETRDTSLGHLVSEHDGEIMSTVTNDDGGFGRQGEVVAGRVGGPEVCAAGVRVCRGDNVHITVADSQK